MTGAQCLVVLLAQSNHGNEHWNKAVKDIFTNIDKCLPSLDDDLGTDNTKSVVIDDTPIVKDVVMDELDVECTRKDLLVRCDVRLLQRLVVSIMKTLDLVSDSNESVIFQPLPVALLWKILYTIIVR